MTCGHRAQITENLNFLPIRTTHCVNIVHRLMDAERHIIPLIIALTSLIDNLSRENYMHMWVHFCHVPCPMWALEIMFCQTVRVSLPLLRADCFIHFPRLVMYFFLHLPLPLLSTCLVEYMIQNITGPNCRNKFGGVHGFGYFPHDVAGWEQTQGDDARLWITASLPYFKLSGQKSMLERGRGPPLEFAHDTLWTSLTE